MNHESRFPSTPWRTRLRTWGLAAGVMVGLSACGGSGSESVALPPPSPLLGPQALDLASSASLLGYQQGLATAAAASADMLEPFDVSALSLPSTETAEPIDLP